MPYFLKTVKSNDCIERKTKMIKQQSNERCQNQWILIIFNNFQKMFNLDISTIQGAIQDSDTMINVPDGFDAPLFTWNPDRISSKLKLNDEFLICQSTTGSGFKTVLGTQIFTEGGRYYFQIFINKGQLLKVGVCRPNVGLEEAFCDTVNGWGIYNGQLRHNSNSTGAKYGSQLKAGDILGVGLDMIEGTLTYYRNGVSWGIAYRDQQLKKGELVAAVAPIYNNDVFTLRSMLKQD